MKKYPILSIIIAGVFTSCYFVNDIFDPPVEKEVSLQERSQQAVTQYLKTTAADNTYQPYGFGEITIHKPKDIVDLEMLEAQNKQNPSTTLDTAIAQKKRWITENNIERSVDLDHFFTLKDSNGKLVVYETNFLLNDTLGVKKLTAKIVLNTTEKYEDALTYFFYEYNIFSTPSYYESKTLSANFYAFFKEELENRKEREEKSAFLLHTLMLTHEIKEKGTFEQQQILQEMVRDYISTERTDIAGYEEMEFSPLYQMQQENTEEVKGYYFFHKFIGTFQEQSDTNVVLIEFSKFYELNNIYQMDRPFNTYFNQE